MGPSPVQFSYIVFLKYSQVFQRCDDPDRWGRVVPRHADRDATVAHGWETPS
jgi:hypothetical protein